MGSSQEDIDELVKSTKNTADQENFRSEGPQHRVKLTQPFYLGTFEVTQQQYEQVVGEKTHRRSQQPGPARTELST